MRQGKMKNMTFVKEIGNETSISVCSAEKSKWLLRISESAKNFEIHKLKIHLDRNKYETYHNPTKSPLHPDYCDMGFPLHNLKIKYFYHLLFNLHYLK